MEKKELDLFNPTKAELWVLAAQYTWLEINWVDDKEGLKKVHDAEMVLKNTRVTISKTRLAYTAPKTAEIKQAIELEKEMLWIITPIEDDLKAKKKVIEVEKDRIKQEKKEEERVFLQNRINELAKFNYVYPDVFELSQISETDFYIKLQSVETVFNGNEAKRIEEEKQEKIRIENEQIERDEFNKKQKKLKEDQDKLALAQKKIDDGNKKLEDDKIEAQRKKDEEKARLDREADDKKLKEDEEQEKLEKDKKYKDFLKKYEWQYDTIYLKDWKKILYKKIAEFII